MDLKHTALVIVDMQKYYLLPESDYCRYFDMVHPNSLDYIRKRCRDMVIPNIKSLIDHFRANEGKVLYLRLVSNKKSRSDLHRFFKQLQERAKEKGLKNTYPLAEDPMADVVDELKPHSGDLVYDKHTFSPYTRPAFQKLLKENDIKDLVITGLSTSQCVETTARDASDRGYKIYMIEDAQADYDETTHIASIYSSQGVCGDKVMLTRAFLNN